MVILAALRGALCAVAQRYIADTPSDVTHFVASTIDNHSIQGCPPSRKEESFESNPLVGTACLARKLETEISKYQFSEGECGVQTSIVLNNSGDAT